MKMNTQYAGDMHAIIQKAYGLTDLDRVEQWGPIIEYQYDASGQTPIQRFATLVVRMETGVWLMVRQICSIQNGAEWPSRPFVREVSASDAEFWLKEHRFETLKRV